MWPHHKGHIGIWVLSDDKDFKSMNHLEKNIVENGKYIAPGVGMFL